MQFIVNSVKARLVGTEDDSYGRLEVNYRGIWGTICQHGFTMISANVTCKQLGYVRGAIRFYGGAVYGPGNGTIWLTNVKCSGNEINIAQCSHSYWGESNCDHDKDVSIVCNPGKCSTYTHDISCITFMSTYLT